MNPRQIVSAGKRFGIALTQLEAQRFRFSSLHLARFSEYRRKKEDQFATSVPLRYGIVHVDLAFFYPKMRQQNRGCKALVVAVELATRQLYVCPVKNKTLDEWKRAIRGLLQSDVITAVRGLVSDRETALTSAAFQDWLFDACGARIAFLKSRQSHAFLAERMIRFLKSRTAMLVTKLRDRRWTELVQKVVSEYNSRRIEGTRFVRADVNSSNFLAFLGQKWKMEDASARFNARRLSLKSLPSAIKEKVFRIPLGKRVLLLRHLDPVWLKVCVSRHGGSCSKTAHNALM